ncbi:MAG: hypothetical protein QOJ95_2751 [Mycobacterium sp.]|nr:hypothetical protein [Mycobacterium sp.]
MTHADRSDYGFDDICAALSDRFGTRFEVRRSGGDCVIITARLEGGFEVLVTDCENTLSPLRWHREGRAAGLFVGVHRIDGDGEYIDPPAQFAYAYSENALPTADVIARLVQEAMDRARVGIGPIGRPRGTVLNREA